MLGELRRSGVTPVVIAFDPPARVAQLKAALGLEMLMVSDVSRQAYRAYGLQRGSRWQVWGPRVIWRYLTLIWRGRRLQRPHVESDLYQLGADFLLDRSGRLAWAHVSCRPDDRPTPEALLRACRQHVERG